VNFDIHLTKKALICLCIKGNLDLATHSIKELEPRLQSKILRILERCHSEGVTKEEILCKLTDLMKNHTKEDIKKRAEEKYLTIPEKKCNL
jgi:hypothetical protein